MAIVLTIEDGTGITGANTYVSQADAVTYATNWNNTSFINASSDNQNSALFQAAFAMDKLYGRKYISVVPSSSLQGLLWPRYSIMGNDFRMYYQGQSLPQCLKDAECELASMYLSGIGLFPNESQTRQVRHLSEKVGSISISTEMWQIPTDTERYDGFRKVELILQPIIECENNDGARWTL
jgi:hypothetical protein